MVMAAPRSAKLVEAKGARFTLLLGYVFVLLAFLTMLLLWGEDSSYWQVGLAYAFVGIGVGLAGTPASHSLTCRRRIKEPLRERVAGEHLRLFVLERAQVLRADLGADLEVVDVEVRALACLPQRLTDAGHVDAEGYGLFAAVRRSGLRRMRACRQRGDDGRQVGLPCPPPALSLTSKSIMQ